MVSNKPRNEYKYYNKTDDNSEKKFYKMYNYSFIKKNNSNNYNIDNPGEKTKTFYNSNTPKLGSKPKSRRIIRKKSLNISISSKKKKNIFFNNHLLPNNINNFNNIFNTFSNNLTEFIKKDESYINKQKNLFRSLDENDKNEKEIKQFSLTIYKREKNNSYSVKDLKKGYIKSSYYKMDNGSKFENIKTNYDSINPKKYKLSPKFSSLFF